MRVLGTLRAVLGTIYSRASAAVPVPPDRPAVATPLHRPILEPRWHPVPVIAAPSGVAFAIRLGEVWASGASQFELAGITFSIEFGLVSAVGSALAMPTDTSQDILSGAADAVGFSPVMAAAPQMVTVYVPVRARKDHVDRAWTDLQREEDELLELLGILE